MKFSHRETSDLIFAGFMISLAFAILLNGGFTGLLSFKTGLVLVFVASFFTAGVGFLLHEIMHKFVAQSYGLKAEFRAFNGMLWLAVLFSLFGFILAAPGAVFISGRMINREKNGKISLAGPMTNIILAGLFLIAILIIGNYGVLGYFLKVGLTINALLGAFNMIPIMPFDGAKIILWNKGVYWGTALLALGLFIASFAL